MLYLAVSNMRSHLSLNDLDVNLSLKCDMNGKNCKKIILECDEIKPCGTKSYLITDLWPSLGSNNSDLSTLISVFDLNIEDLKFIKEVWIDITVNVKHNNATEWLPSGHLVIHETLSNDLFLNMIK
jgi:hypothetical protein